LLYAGRSGTISNDFAIHRTIEHLKAEVDSCSIQQSSCYTCYTEDMCFVNNGLADKTSTEPGLGSW